MGKIGDFEKSVKNGMYYLFTNEMKTGFENLTKYIY